MINRKEVSQLVKQRSSGRHIEIDVEDDVLASTDADRIDEFLQDGTFPWYYCKDLNFISYPGNYYFVHHVIDDYQVMSPYMDILSPIVRKYNINPQAISRVKINMYPWTHRRVHHQPHIDYAEDSNKRTILYYVNSTNAPTYFETGWRKTKVECVKNRAIIFDGSFPHHSTSPTNSQYRCSVNIDVQL